MIPITHYQTTRRRVLCGHPVEKEKPGDKRPRQTSDWRLVDCANCQGLLFDQIGWLRPNLKVPRRLHPHQQRVRDKLEVHDLAEPYREARP